MQYSKREKIKKLGYRKLHSKKATEQENSALLVLLAHYDRSLEHAIEMGRYHNHPNISEYISVALNSAMFIPLPIRENLKNMFESKEGELDGSYWPNSVFPGTKVVKNQKDVIRERLLKLVDF